MNPLAVASEERLTHFQCARCAGWWSIGDFWARRRRLADVLVQIYCPWCGAVLDLPNDPGEQMVQPLELTAEQIAPAFPGVKLANVRTYWPPVAEALREARLESPMIVAYALATIAAESAGFEPLTEFKSKYNTRRRPYDRYEGRRDLGNTESGDGARFCGRGFIQLTGRANYARYGDRLYVDLLGNPELANDPVVAARILALFIADREARILSALQAQDWARARKAVNGGTHGMSRFLPAYQTIMRVLKVG